MCERCIKNGIKRVASDFDKCVTVQDAVDVCQCYTCRRQIKEGGSFCNVCLGIERDSPRIVYKGAVLPG